MSLGHGAVDFAGSGVVHATGGWTALALAILLGPRIGKFNKDGTPNAIPGHNIPFVVIGTFILLFGWMGFNPGSTLGATDLRIAVIIENTATASVFGAAAAMAYTAFVYGKPDISMSCNGMLAGLVAITAPCAFVAPYAAAIIGLVAGILVCVSVWFWDNVAHVDDPCGAVSVHGSQRRLGRASRWACSPTARTARAGTASAATSTGLFYGDAGQFGAQAVSVAVCFAWAFGVTTVDLRPVQDVHVDAGVARRPRSWGSTCRSSACRATLASSWSASLHGSIPAELIAQALASQTKPVLEPGSASA